MQSAFKLHRHCLVLGAMLTGLVVASCTADWYLKSEPSYLDFRIENASGGTVDVSIQITDRDGNAIDSTTESATSVEIPVVEVTPDGVSYSTLEPIGAAAAAQESTESSNDDLDTSATVSVPGYEVSEGRMASGPVVTLIIASDASTTGISISGDGTGTPGFDSAAVGDSGQRYLIRGDHFQPGQKIVIRVDKVESASGQTGYLRGELAVINADEESPFDPIEQATDPNEDPDEEPAATTVTVQMYNKATIIADLNLAISTTSEDQTYNVSVPANAVTEGEFPCGTVMTLTATFPSSGQIMVDGTTDESEAAIILTGDGTGAVGFDEASVSADGQRILILDSHVECGQVVRVTILDDSSVATPTGFNPNGIGAGTVQVFNEGENPDTGGGSGSSTTPDMSITINNNTSEFVRLNVQSGSSGVGQQFDIYVPSNSQSTGEISCADRYTLSAFSLQAEALEGLLDSLIIVLSGDGAGTAGFDEGSVGSAGQRLILLDSDYECGDEIVVTITDPGQPGFSEPDEVNTNGEVTGFTDVNGNGIQDEIPDELGSGTVSIE